MFSRGTSLFWVKLRRWLLIIVTAQGKAMQLQLIGIEESKLLLVLNKILFSTSFSRDVMVYGSWYLLGGVKEVIGSVQTGNRLLACWRRAILK